MSYCLKKVLNSSCQAFFPLPTLPFSKCSKANSFLKRNMLLGRQEEILNRTFLCPLVPQKHAETENYHQPTLPLANLWK